VPPARLIFAGSKDPVGSGHSSCEEENMAPRTVTMALLLVATLAACDPMAEATDDEGGSNGIGEPGGAETDELDVTGSWLGTCEGILPGTSASSTYDVELELVEGDQQDIDGTMALSGVDEDGVPQSVRLSVAGARTEAEVFLELGPADGSTTTATTTTGYTFQIVLELTIAGDTLDGELVFFPNGTGGYESSSLACTLAREGR
jgi:hypothetical protein